MPLTTPMGIAKAAPMPVTISDPMMAFAMPPPVSPTGLGICVKKDRLSDDTPWVTT